MRHSLAGLAHREGYDQRPDKSETFWEIESPCGFGVACSTQQQLGRSLISLSCQLLEEVEFIQSFAMTSCTLVQKFITLLKRKE